MFHIALPVQRDTQRERAEDGKHAEGIGRQATEEQGRHEELLARGGVYARYWNRQSGGFLGTEDRTEAAE